MNLKSILKSDDRASLVSVPFLMTTMGAIAFLFPIIMWLGQFFDQGELALLGSISEYYYTASGDLFVGLLFMIGVFLMAYTGFAKLDMYLSTLAGLFSMGIALFPTGCALEYGYCENLCGEMCNQTTTLHFVFAALFLIILMIFCFFIFTQNSKRVYWRSTFYFWTYFSSGVLMAIALLAILIYKLLSFPPDHGIHWFRPIFVFETISLWAFGVSWMVKSNWLKDHLRKLESGEK